MEIDRKNLELAVELRHELHMHPEHSEHETETKARLIRFLKEHTSLKIVDKGRWFYAVYDGGGTKASIGFRADFDALPMEDAIDAPYKSVNPGCAHKCGHDGHAANLCLFALELERTKPERKVCLVFQHAEENGAGAKECGDFISENKIGEIYAFHNNNKYDLGTIRVFHYCYGCASMGMNIRMKGVPTHASTPEFGKNPAATLCRVGWHIHEIADPAKFKQLVLATIVEIKVGDHAFGMSASDGTIGVTLRAEKLEDMYTIRDEIISYASGLAEEGGFEVEFSYEDVFPDTQCTPDEVEKVVRAAEACGLPVVCEEHPNRGSEDFGWFTKLTKGAMFSVCTGTSTPSLHSREYDFPDKVLPYAAEMFLTLVNMD